MLMASLEIVTVSDKHVSKAMYTSCFDY